MTSGWLARRDATAKFAAAALVTGALLFSLAVAGVYFSLRASMGDFITVFGTDITPVMLGEIGAAFIILSAAYTDA